MNAKRQGLRVFWLAAIFATGQQAKALDADVFAPYLNVAQDALVGQFGFFGVTSAIEFGDSSQWLHATGTTGPMTASQGGRPLTVTDRFHIGSQTKTFTGTVVLQFVDEGVIDLDDTLQVWFERQPEATNALAVMTQQQREAYRVRDLLSMRTGIADYLNGADPGNPEQTIVAVWNSRNGHYNLSREQLLGSALAEAPTMPPGDETTFQYSNTNYTLVGIVAEAASCETGDCRSIGELITERVIEPLGLTNTLYPTGTEWGTDQHTNGNWNQGGVVSDFTFTTPSVPNSAGAMISNVVDQLAWSVELTTNRNRTLDPQTFAERLQNTTTMSGNVAGIPAGYGFAIYGQNSPTTGAFSFGHGGELSGYQTLMFHYPGDAGTTADDLFVVSNLNSFLSSPLERQFPTAQINDYYFDLQETVALVTAFLADPNGCVSVAGDLRCTGTTVADRGRELQGTFTLQPSGYRWTNGQSGFDQPVPTYVFYGHDAAAVRVTDAVVEIQDQAILKGYGNNVVLLQLDGTDNRVRIDGEIESIGANALAIDASSPANDRVTVSPGGRVTGAVDITSGADHLAVEGSVTGDVSTGRDALVSGSGRINGLVSGMGRVAPGSETALGTLTVTRYQAANGVLDIRVDGTADRSDLLAVEVQDTTNEGFAVPDTGVAILSDGRLRLRGSAPQGDRQIPFLTAATGVTGNFAQVEYLDGMRQSVGRNELNVLNAGSTLALANTSPAVFDSTAEASYRASLAVLDSMLDGATSEQLRAGDGIAGFSVVLGERSSFNAQDQVSGYRLDIGGLLAGMGGTIGGSGLWSLAVAKTTAQARINHSGRDQEVDTAMIAMNAGFALGSVDLGLVLAYGAGDIDYHRDLGAATASGETDHQRWVAGMELSRDYAGTAWNWGWGGSLSFVHEHQDGFAESSRDGIPLSFGARDFDRLRLGLGAKAFVPAAAGRLSPWISGELFQHLDLNREDVPYFYQGAHLGELEGRSADALEFRITGGIVYALGRGAVLKAGLYASGSDEYTNVGLTSSINVAF